MANTVDIAPELLEAITKEIQEAVEKDPVLQKVLQSIEDGTVTSADMYKYAERYGEIEADALSKYLTEENLPNGRLYQNIAERTVMPTMRDAEQHVNHVAAEIQTAINKGAGLNIKGVEADVDMDHITGITKKLAYSDSIDRVSYLLRDPMITTLMHGVDRTIQKNVELHADAGLNPIVKRISVGGCCEWCQERAGTYDYIEDDLWNNGTEVYRRHNFCRCLVLYNPMDGKGQWQNVHHQQDWGSQRELSAKESARRQARIDVSKQVANEQFEKRSQREKRYRELLDLKYREIERNNGGKGEITVSVEPKNGRSIILLQSVNKNGQAQRRENNLPDDGVLAKHVIAHQIDPEELAERAKVLIPKDGYDDVIIHGDIYGFFVIDAKGKEYKYSVVEIADYLKKYAVFENEKIRLVSCETGREDSIVAQALANELQMEVYAPTKYAYLNYTKDERGVRVTEALSVGLKNGRPNLDDMGEWKTFTPKPKT